MKSTDYKMAFGMMPTRATKQTFIDNDSMTIHKMVEECRCEVIISSGGSSTGTYVSVTVKNGFRDHRSKSTRYDNSNGMISIIDDKNISFANGVRIPKLVNGQVLYVD